MHDSDTKHSVPGATHHLSPADASLPRQLSQPQPQQQLKQWQCDLAVLDPVLCCPVLLALVLRIPAHRAPLERVGGGVVRAWWGPCRVMVTVAGRGGGVVVGVGGDIQPDVVSGDTGSKH